MNKSKHAKKQHGRIFYISDLHLFHNRILELTNRPFKTIEQMHECMISKWKKKVSIHDTVYILGDVGMYHAKEIADILKELPGKKILITGNHDVYNLKNRYFQSAFEKYVPYTEILDNGRKVALFHYPIEEWDGYYRGFYHLHGHVHDKDDVLVRIEKRYNVSADRLDFEPCTLDEIIELDKLNHWDEFLNQHSIDTIHEMETNIPEPDQFTIDSDTVLAGITESNIYNNGMHIAGIAGDIFRIWCQSKDKKSVEMMFYEFTDVEFKDYLSMCISQIKTQLKTLDQAGQE